MSTTPPTDPDTGDQSLDELVLRAKEGDRDAAYEVLGRQVSVEAWVAVIRRLALDATEADLELVAHRALRRPASVVKAVLDLARAAGTPQAAFLARVISEARDEEHLRTEAETLGAELVSLSDVEALQAEGDSKGALYSLIARPISEQAKVVAKLGDGDGLTSLLDEARREYERLQDVARDTRWRSGSYRHVLRHALADLALLAGVGDRFEEQAYRLLQQRTERPDENGELLGLVSPELRSRYLQWALERASAEASPARAQFALAELRASAEAVDRPTIRRLLTSTHREVAVAAAIHLVVSDPSDASDDHEIAELITQSGAEASLPLIEAMISSAPERLRLDLWPASEDTVVIQSSSGRSEVAGQLACLIERAEGGARTRLLRVVAALDVDDATDSTAGAPIARAVLERDESQEEELELLAASWLNAGAWAMLAGFISTRAGRRLLERLASHGEPPLVWRHLESLRDRVADEQHQPLDGLLLDLIADGTLVASKEAPAPGGTMHVALEQPAAARAAAATEELQRLRSLVALGDRAAETELAGFIAPLVERAVERSTGNTRLQSDYQELNAAFGTSAGEPSTESALDADVVADISDALAPIEIEVELAGGAIRVRDRGASAEQLVRAVALVDQRLSRTPASDTRTTLPQVQRALAVRATEAGVAQDLLSALFERGPLFQVAVGLSPDTRLELLNAARVAGFEIPARWTSHQVLGGWLREALGEAPSTGITDSGDALTRLAEVEAARREMEQRLHDARLAAREAFAVAASVPLDHLEQTADAYVQLWLGLSRLGIRQIAALGQLMQRDELDPNRHELVGDDTGESTVLFVVRSAGLAVGDRIVRRARLEAAS